MAVDPAPSPPARGEEPAAAAPVRQRGLRHAFVALSYRDFGLFWGGAFVSNIGTWMQSATVPYVIYRLGHNNPTWIGLATAAQFLPALVFAPMGGVIADRVSRKIALIGSQAAAGLVALALWATWSTHHATPLNLVGLLMLLGVTTGFGMPAWQSMVPQLVPPERMMSAVTLNSVQFNGSRAIGPMIGGLVLARFKAGAVFALNAFSYLFVVGALVVIRTRYAMPPAAKTAGRSGSPFAGAISYMREHEGIRLVLGTVGVATFFGGPVVTLTAVFDRTVYHHGTVAYAVLYSCFGFGAVVGALALGGWFDGVRRSRIASSAVVFFGAAVLGMGLNPYFALGFVMLFAIGIGYIALVSTLLTSLHLMVADEYRGRVMALYGMSFTLAFPLGSLVMSLFTHAFGVRPVTAVFGVVLLAFGVWLVQRRDTVAIALDARPHHVVH
jgi:MFS family permease